MKSKKKIHYCTISGKPIPAARVEALISLGIPETQWTCVEHSQVKKVKGIYMGENGTSELKLVDKIYDDSVRSVFKKIEVEDSGDSNYNIVEEE